MCLARLRVRAVPMYAGPAGLSGVPCRCAQDLLDFLACRRGQCGIIYARLRATCDWLAREIGNAEVVEAAAYHAGKDAEQRSRVRGTAAGEAATQA